MAQTARLPAPLHRFLQLLRRVGQELGHDDFGGLAAQMTYFFMLGLFPTLILVLGLLDALPLEQDVERIARNMLSGLPPEIATMLQDYLRDFAAHRPSSGLLFWLVAAMWAASRGLAGARKGLDQVFRGGTRRSALFKRAQDLLLTGGGILMLGLVYLLLLGALLLVATLLGAAGSDPRVAAWFPWLAWPLALVLATGVVMLLYRLLPARRLAWRHLLAGALPVVLAWSALTAAARAWLHLLGGYDRVYGSLASFFLLMFLVWLYSLTLLLGGEIAVRVASRAESRTDTDDIALVDVEPDRT